MVIVLAVVFLTYLILLPIAFGFDRKDRKKEIIILEDNEPERKYLYLIVVSTGFQRGSGTTAHVAVQLRGDLGNSRVYVLGHPTQSILRQGSVDTFLLATETSVGNVNEVLIFHDFHGLQPNWYLRTVIVHDVQLDRQWTISVFRWLTIREAQGNLQFVFKCDRAKTRPKIGFIERASEKFCEEHLLYSIFNKPPLSHFTCVQRLSCFLCVRLLTMLASLMFYGIPRRDKTAQIEVGEFTFSFRQIVIGVESSLVIIPVTFILVLLFSKSKPKRSSYISNIGPQHRMELSFVAQKPRESDPFAFRYHIYSYIDCPRPSVDVPQTFNFRTILSSEYELPHWCAYVAWTLVFLCCAMASYMIILYGLRYGRIGSLNWLVTTITAVLECIFFQEPFLIMVELALIMLLSSLLGQSKGRSLFERIRFPVWRHWNRNYFKFQKQRHYSPLPNQKLQEVEHRNLVRQQTATRVFEIIGFCLFFSSLWTIVIQVKNPIAYQLTHYVKETFINRYHHKEDSHYALQLQQVSNVDQLYEYVEGIVVNGLHDNEWRLDTETNDNPAIDNNIQLLGVARLRQLRVKPDACESAKILNGSIQHCAPNYYTSINDDGNYLPYWLPWKDAINHSMTSPWIFRRSDYPLSHIIYGHLTTYLDNGYKAELGRNKKNSKLVLKYLSDHNWIDKFTRAVFCEFTLYNTDCNYFTQVTIVFELSAAGAIFPDYHIWTFRPFGYFQQFTPTLVSSIVVFTALFLSYLTWEVVQMIRLKRDYFKDFWNYVDMSILIGCVLMFIFYGIYLDSVRRCVDRIHQTKKNLFVSFYPAVIWDTVSTSTFGLVVCFNMFKVWKLLTFNKRMYTFVMTIREATVAIFNFGIMYMITLMAFIHATYILLGPYDHTFQSIGRNWLHYILFTFGHTAFQPYVNYNPAMGLTIFLLFTLTVYYYLRNMFEAIMMFNFKKVRKDIQKMKNMYEMVKYFRAKLEFMVAYRSSVTRSNETWLEIEQKLTEINNICEVMIERLNR